MRPASAWSVPTTFSTSAAVAFGSIVRSMTRMTTCGKAARSSDSAMSCSMVTTDGFGFWFLAAVVVMAFGPLH